MPRPNSKRESEGCLIPMEEENNKILNKKNEIVDVANEPNATSSKLFEPTVNHQYYYVPTLQRSLLQNAFVSSVRPISGIKSLKWTSDNVINRVTKKLALLHSAEKLFEGPVDDDDDDDDDDISQEAVNDTRRDHIFGENNTNNNNNNNHHNNNVASAPKLRRRGTLLPSPESPPTGLEKAPEQQDPQQRQNPQLIRRLVGQEDTESPNPDIANLCGNPSPLPHSQRRRRREGRTYLDQASSLVTYSRIACGLQSVKNNNFFSESNKNDDKNNQGKQEETVDFAKSETRFPSRFLRLQQLYARASLDAANFDAQEKQRFAQFQHDDDDERMKLQRNKQQQQQQQHESNLCKNDVIKSPPSSKTTHCGSSQDNSTKSASGDPVNARDTAIGFNSLATTTNATTGGATEKSAPDRSENLRELFRISDVAETNDTNINNNNKNNSGHHIIRRQDIPIQLMGTATYASSDAGSEPSTSLRGLVRSTHHIDLARVKNVCQVKSQQRLVRIGRSANHDTGDDDRTNKELINMSAFMFHSPMSQEAEEQEQQRPRHDDRGSLRSASLPLPPVALEQPMSSPPHDPSNVGETAPLPAAPLSPFQAQANPHRRLQRFYGKILKKMILGKNKRALERTRNAFVLMKADFDLSEMSYEVSCQEFADALNHQRNVLIEEERSHRRILENIEHESFEMAWNKRSGKNDNNNNNNNSNNNAAQEYVFDTRKIIGEQNAKPTETTIPRYQSPLHHSRTYATASKTALIRLPINDKIKRQEQQQQQPSTNASSQKIYSDAQSYIVQHQNGASDIMDSHHNYNYNFNSINNQTDLFKTNNNIHAKNSYFGSAIMALGRTSTPIANSINNNVTMMMMMANDSAKKLLLFPQVQTSGEAQIDFAALDQKKLQFGGVSTSSHNSIAIQKASLTTVPGIMELSIKARSTDKKIHDVMLRAAFLGSCNEVDEAENKKLERLPQQDEDNGENEERKATTQFQNHPSHQSSSFIPPPVRGLTSLLRRPFQIQQQQNHKQSILRRVSKDDNNDKYLTTATDATATHDDVNSLNVSFGMTLPIPNNNIDHKNEEKLKLDRSTKSSSCALPSSSHRLTTSPALFCTVRSAIISLPGMPLQMLQRNNGKHDDKYQNYLHHHPQNSKRTANEGTKLDGGNEDGVALAETRKVGAGSVVAAGAETTNSSRTTVARSEGSHTLFTTDAHFIAMRQQLQCRMESLSNCDKQEQERQHESASKSASIYCANTGMNNNSSNTRQSENNNNDGATSYQQQLQQHSYATTCHIEDDILKELVEIGSPSIVSSFLEASPSVFDAKFSCARYPGRFKPIQQIGKGTYGTAYLVVYRENKALIDEQKRLQQELQQELQEKEKKMQKRQNEKCEAKRRRVNVENGRKRSSPSHDPQLLTASTISGTPTNRNNNDENHNFRKKYNDDNNISQLDDTENGQDGRSTSARGLLVFDERFTVNTSCNNYSNKDNNNNNNNVNRCIQQPQTSSNLQAATAQLSSNASLVVSALRMPNQHSAHNNNNNNIRQPPSPSDSPSQQQQTEQQQEPIFSSINMQNHKELHELFSVPASALAEQEKSTSSCSADDYDDEEDQSSLSSEIVIFVEHEPTNISNRNFDVSPLFSTSAQNLQSVENPEVITLTGTNKKDAENDDESNNTSNNTDHVVFHSMAPAKQDWLLDDELSQRLEHVQHKKMLQELEKHCVTQNQHAPTTKIDKNQSRSFTSFRNKFSDMQRKSKRLLPIAGPAGAVSAMAASTEAISVNVTVRVGSNNNNNNNNNENNNSNQRHNNKNSSNAGGAKAAAHPPPVTTAVRQLKFSRDVLFVCKVEKLISPDILKSKQKVRDRMALPDYDSDFLDDNGDIIEDEEEYKKKQEGNKEHPSQIMFGGRRSSADDSNSNSNNNNNKSPKRAKQNDGEKKLLVMEANKKRLERMQNEADILSNIAHPNIVAFVDYFFDKKANQQLLFLEYVDGGDLRKDIEKRCNDGPRFFTIESVLHIFVQIVLAVEYLHRHNILHRDIKSQNILISKHYFAKLTDFGTSKQFDQDVDGLVDTKLVGTPLYISPELVAGKPYSQKSDIWALGVLLFELLNFDYPFDGDTFQDMANDIRSSPPRLYSRQVPAEIVELVSRMLEKDPEMRPTAAQVLTEFPAMKIAAEYYEGRLKKFAASETSTKVDSVWFSVLSEHLDLLCNRSGKYNLLKRSLQQGFLNSGLVTNGSKKNSSHSNNLQSSFANSASNRMQQVQISSHRSPSAKRQSTSSSTSSSSSSCSEKSCESSDKNNDQRHKSNDDNNDDDESDGYADDVVERSASQVHRRRGGIDDSHQRHRRSRSIDRTRSNSASVDSSKMSNRNSSSASAHHRHMDSPMPTAELLLLLDASVTSQRSRAHCSIVRGLQAKTRNLQRQNKNVTTKI